MLNRTHQLNLASSERAKLQQKLKLARDPSLPRSPEEFIHWLKTCPDEKLVIRTIRRLRREFAHKNPIIVLLSGMTLPKKRGRPRTRSLVQPFSEPKPRGRPKGRYATDAYSPLSIVIAWTLKKHLLSKAELARLLSAEGVIPEGYDKSDARPFHCLDSLAKVGQETIRFHPENRRLLSERIGKKKDRAIEFLKQFAADYLYSSKS